LKLNLKLPASQTIMEFVESGKLRIQGSVGNDATIRSDSFLIRVNVVEARQRRSPLRQLYSRRKKATAGTSKRISKPKKTLE